jgi:hypothetical protein
MAAVLLLAAVTELGLLSDAGVSGAASRTRGPAPTVTSFAASPLALFSTGGAATLSADVTNATTCTFSSNKPVTGLPVSVPCASGPVSEGITVPGTTTKKPVVYKFVLTVAGTKTIKAKADLTVAPPYCSDIEPGADLVGCDLSDAALPDAALTGAELSHANLTGTDLTGATLTQANLTLANLSDVSAEGALFINATLSDAKLPDADLNGADLSGARMTDTHMTDLEFTDLDGSDLQGADLTDADLDNGYLASVDLTGVVWDDTICPDGSNSDNRGGTCVNNLG